MGFGVLLIGLLIAVSIAVACIKALSNLLRGLMLIAAAGVLLLSAALSTVAFVGANEVGIVTKNALGPKLTEGRIIAVDGETGVQSQVLAPGWHFWYIPIIHSVRTVPLVEIKADELGLIESRDGLPLPEGQLFAQEWDQASFQQMLDATYFLTTGKGFKGKQASVLTPGKYRINTELFRITPIKQTEILAGEVGVLKANFGTPASRSWSKAAWANRPPATRPRRGRSPLKIPNASASPAPARWACARPSSGPASTPSTPTPTPSSKSGPPR